MINIKDHIEKAADFVNKFNEYEKLTKDFNELCFKTGGTTRPQTPRCIEFSFEKCFGPIENISKEDLKYIKNNLRLIDCYNSNCRIEYLVKLSDGTNQQYDVYNTIKSRINDELLKRLAQDSGFSEAELVSEVNSFSRNR